MLTTWMRAGPIGRHTHVQPGLVHAVNLEGPDGVVGVVLVVVLTDAVPDPCNAHDRGIVGGRCAWRVPVAPASPVTMFVGVDAGATARVPAWQPAPVTQLRGYSGQQRQGPGPLRTTGRVPVRG